MTKPAQSWGAICLTTLLSIAAVTQANAATLITPSIDVVPADNLVCRMVNGGSKLIKVRLEVVDAITGQALVDDTVAIPSGTAQVIDTFDARVTGFCRFTGAFKRSDVRASLDVFSGGRTILVTPAE